MECRTESAPEETVIVSVEAEWSVVQSQHLKKPPELVLRLSGVSYRVST